MSTQHTRLLVVGGNGFIGKHIVRRALDQHWDVTVLGRHASDQPAAGATMITADIADRAALGAALQGKAFDYVVNCGGNIDHRLYSSGGQAIFEAHFHGVLNLVAVLPRDVLRSFVNFGSSDEYGIAEAPQAESRREAPISPYSLGKVCATHFLQMLHRTEHFPAVVLRLFLTYGPGQDNGRFLPQIIEGCLTGDEFPVSEGRQLRDFCYVTDVVDAVFLALDCSAAHGEVINIASGRLVSIRQVIEAVKDIVGRGAPLYGKVPYRVGENMALYADTGKAKQLLGWSARTPLDSGLTKTIEWMMAQK